jgi:hypothetical protein
MQYVRFRSWMLYEFPRLGDELPGPCRSYAGQDIVGLSRLLFI